MIGVLPDESEEEKEIVFFWPTVAFSDEIISMTPQNVRDKLNELGTFSYEPLPSPDHIIRTVVRKDLSNGIVFEGEVDEQGQLNGRGILFNPARSFYEGYFFDGKKNGRGRAIAVNGGSY